MIYRNKLPEDIKYRLNNAKRLLKDDKNVVFAYLFGGFGRDEIKPLSDIDIAVYLKKSDKISDYKLNLISKLILTLGTDEIDLVVLNHAPISIVGRILKSRKVLVDKNPSFRKSYELLMLRQFFDFTIKESQLLKWRFNLG